MTHYKNILVKRDQLLGPNLPTFYDKPVHLVKGKDVWVWDIDGKKYKDLSLMGVGCNIMGYSNKQIDDAVVKALIEPINFTP